MWFTVQCWLTDWTELSGEYLRLAVMSELCSALSDCLTVPGLQAPPALLTRRAQHGEMELNRNNIKTSNYTMFGNLHETHEGHTTR